MLFLPAETNPGAFQFLQFCAKFVLCSFHRKARCSLKLVQLFLFQSGVLSADIECRLHPYLKPFFVLKSLFHHRNSKSQHSQELRPGILGAKTDANLSRRI